MLNNPKEHYRQKFMSRINSNDIMHKGFLRPTEIKLMDSSSLSDKDKGGLKLVYKQNISDNKYIDHGFRYEEINSGSPYDKICEAHQNNLISLLKAIHSGDHQYHIEEQTNMTGSLQLLNVIQAPIGKQSKTEVKYLEKKNRMQLLICVCMYNEQQVRLRDTLRGIEKNLYHFEEADIHYDDIAVVVIMDGIEKINTKLMPYIKELQLRSRMNLEEQEMTLTTKEIQKLKNSQQQQTDYTRAINNILFSPQQLQDRNSRRLCSVYKSYLQIRKLKQQVQQLIKSHNNSQIIQKMSHNKIQQFFIAIARRQLQKVMDPVYCRAMTDDDIINECSEDNPLTYDIALETLKEVHSYCEEYITTRNSLAYLLPFRIMLNNKGQQQHDQTILDNSQQHKNKENTSSDKNTITRSKEIAGLYSGDATMQNMVELKSNQSSYEEHKKLVPRKNIYLNLFLCVKYRNAGKLSSHNWFFNGFCKELQPQFVVLLDVGLKPDDDALFKMYKHLKCNKQTGGVCGLMCLKLEEEDDSSQQELDIFSRLFTQLFSIQRAQQVEYNFNHVVDKSFEALFGFIHVLPGAFSAYNMKALTPIKSTDANPLMEYFKSINEKLKTQRIEETTFNFLDFLMRFFLPNFVYRHFYPLNIFTQQQMMYSQNVYLAEDRILCMLIHKLGFSLDYLPDACSNVDSIRTINGMMGQRKRWINGSEWAFDKVINEINTGQQKMSCGRLALKFQIFLMSSMNVLAYISPAIMLFLINTSMQAFRSNLFPNLLSTLIPGVDSTTTFFTVFVYTVDLLYLMIFLAVIIQSLHFKHDKEQFRKFIYGVSTALGIFSIIVFVVLLYNIILEFIGATNLLAIQPVENDLFLTIAINSLKYMIFFRVFLLGFALVLHEGFFGNWSLFFQVANGIFSSMFYLPIYLIIFNTYAICRIDDISWGTKDLNKSESRDKSIESTWKILKYIYVGKYIFWNLVFSTVFYLVGRSDISRAYLSFFLMVIPSLLLLVKCVLAVSYMCYYKFCAILDSQLLQKSSLISINDRISKVYQKDIMSQIQDNLDRIIQVYTRHEQRGMLTLGQSIRILIKDRGYRQSTKKDYMSRYSIIHQAKQKKKPLDPPPQLETSPNPISQKQLPPLKITYMRRKGI